VLADQITLRLIPSLIQSFALTATVIFFAFLVVFRSPAARLMAMIPSLFAILVAFLLMRRDRHQFEHCDDSDRVDRPGIDRE
jgi:predicted RND superfamily exporter protein